MISERRRTPESSAGRVIVTSCGCEYSSGLVSTGIYIDMIGDMGNKTIILGRCPACKGGRAVTIFEPSKFGPGEHPAIFCTVCMAPILKKDATLLRGEQENQFNLQVHVDTYLCPECGHEIRDTIFPTESEVFEDE